MKVHFLQQDDYLIASIQASLTDKDLQQFKRQMIEKISVVSPEGVLIDVSELDVLDSFSIRILNELETEIHAREIPMVIAGIKDHVSFTMKQMGLTFSGFTTESDMDQGLELLDTLTTGND